MPLTEQVILDIASAQRQITDLERQLDTLATPIDVPVNVDDTNAISRVRSDLAQADAAAAGLNTELGETATDLRSVDTAARRTGDQLDRAATRGRTAFGGLSTSIVGLVGAFGAIQGARAFLGFASDAITAASELEQSVGALDAVFGALGSQVAEFGATADQSVGLAASEFNALASVLGSQLQTFGFNTADAAAETEKLVTLSADLAATFGGPVSQAVEAVSSLLRGEVNPIERYGVAMNQALVNAKALELGLATSTSEISLQAGTMARLAILTEQTANAQGQFAREATTTAGRLERIRADFANFGAEVGAALVPAFESLLDLVPGIVAALEDTLIPALAGVGSAMASVDATGFLTTLATLPTGIGTVFTGAGEGVSFFANVWGLLASVVTGDSENVAKSFQNMNEAVEGLGNTAEANATINTFIKTLATGAEPAAALEATLVDLADTVHGMTLEGFEPLARQLVDMATAAGATPPELRALAETLRVLGQDAGFSAEGVDILVTELMGPWAQAQVAIRPGDLTAAAQAVALFGDNASGAAPGLGDAASEIEDLADSSDRAATSLREAGDALLALTDPAFAAIEAQGNLGDAQSALAEAVEEFGSRSPEAIQAAIDLAEAEIRLKDAAADLPGGMDAAAGAILDLIDDGEVATTTLDGVKDLLDSLNGTVSEAQLNIRINEFGSTTAGAFRVGPGFEGSQEGGASDGVSNFEINFNTEPNATPATQRALQQVAAIIN